MDATAHLLYAANDLHARAGGMGGDAASRPGSYKIIGLVLAILSGVFIGTSFVIKKHGLLQANEKYNEEAGVGYSYLKNAWWWLGMFLMILGEVSSRGLKYAGHANIHLRYVTLSRTPLPTPSS
jgi:Na+-driven multidrug efflux pump